jgi:hypothetical protein
LNVHVPKAREHVVRELEAVARQGEHAKSQLVLDAIELYLSRGRPPKPAEVELPVYMDMDVIAPLHRADVYEERAGRHSETA